MSYFSFQFKEIAKQLTEAFISELRIDNGAAFYDGSVQLRLCEYIDDFYGKGKSPDNVSFDGDIDLEILQA